MSRSAGSKTLFSDGGRWIRDPRSFYGGMALVGLSIFGLWSSSNLPGQQDVAFGPGTVPRLLAGLLLVLGVAIAVIGLIRDGTGVERIALRGPLMVAASIFTFAVAVRPLGLVTSAFLTFVVAGIASTETKWVENLAAAAVLTAFCAFLFPYALGLPFPLWPSWPLF
jgi:putative tricarboxylic transport membrane protein